MAKRGRVLYGYGKDPYVERWFWVTQVDPHVIPKAPQAGGRRNRITALQGHWL